MNTINNNKKKEIQKRKEKNKRKERYTCVTVYSAPHAQRGLQITPMYHWQEKQEARLIELTHPSRLTKVDHPQMGNRTGGRSDATPRESREVSKRSP